MSEKQTKIGRPPKYGERMVQISLTVTPQQNTWILRQAEARRVSQSQVVRSLIEHVMGMQEVKQ